MNRSARAIVALSSRRSTTRSSMPCSTRNSLRWKPSGSFCRMVCSITRGPANPMRAFGSPMFRSPSMAKLAVTPPVVGSVSTEMYGRRAASSRASAAAIFAICMSESAPSIMRAPPEQETMMMGVRRSMARSMARVIFSPTTTPMLPPMNSYSIAAICTSMPSSRPEAVITASPRPVAARAARRRSVYALVSVKASGSVERSP